MEALTSKIEQTFEELILLLPSTVMEKVSKFVEKVEASQHSKGKERQTRKFQTLQTCQSNSHRAEALTWRNKDVNNTAHLDIQEE